MENNHRYNQQEDNDYHFIILSCVFSCVVEDAQRIPSCRILDNVLPHASSYVILPLGLSSLLYSQLFALPNNQVECVRWVAIQNGAELLRYAWEYHVHLVDLRFSLS